MSLVLSKTTVRIISDFEHSVAQVPDSNLRDASGIVLRVHAELWLEIAQGHSQSSPLLTRLHTEARAVARRAPDLDIYVMPDGHSAAESRPQYAARHGPHLLVSASAPSLLFEPVSQSASDRICQADLADIIDSARARCIVCASSNHHFALPSGAHATQFVRLSDSFVDIQTVDRLAYWVALQIQAHAPLIPTKPFALLVDHPSMLVLAARVQCLVSVPLEVVAFPTYPSDVETRTASFDLLREVTARCAAVFVAIGVASTGRLAQFITNWASQASLERVEVFVMYALLPLTATRVLCQITPSGYQHYSSVDACELCSAHSAAVPVQAATHLVGYAPTDAVALGGACFLEQRQFLERWGKYEGVLRAHYDDPNEFTARHHAFYVDVGTLLEITEFREEVSTAFRNFEPAPDLVVIPDHGTARKLGTLVSQVLGRPLLILDNALVSNGVGNIDIRLQNASCVLVLDDVLISGQRLLGINGFFREQRAIRAPALQRIHYWTILATPPSSAKHRQAERGLTSNHGWTATLTHLYRMVLPDWHDATVCPWCQERKVIQGLVQASGDLEGPSVDRLALLDSVKEGITTDPFVTSHLLPSLPTLGAESVTLSEGSSGMQVLFACASAIQQLRHAASRPLDSDQFPAPTFMAVRNFSTNYTERLIWLGMLRSLKSKELEPSLKQFLRERAFDEADGQRQLVLGELATAWLVGKLGAVDVSQQSKALFEEVGISWESLFSRGLVDRQP
jgi:hypothetical protein